MNRIATALLAALVGAAPLLATATSASADNRYKNGKRSYHQNYNNNARYNNTPNWTGVGAGLAAGAALGLGAGLLINRPPPPRVYYAPPPPPPVVYYPAPQAYYPPPPPPVYYERGWTEAHIEWCLDRYRSYNPATNTFIGYDGYQHVCRGPY